MLDQYTKIWQLLVLEWNLLNEPFECYRLIINIWKHLTTYNNIVGGNLEFH